MIYSWYKIFNLTEFEALGLVSKNYTLDFEDLGQKEILVTKGNLVSILYADVFLPIGLSDENPVERDDHAVYLDDTTQDVYLGIAVDEA